MPSIMIMTSPSYNRIKNNNCKRRSEAESMDVPHFSPTCSLSDLLSISENDVRTTSFSDYQTKRSKVHHPHSPRLRHKTNKQNFKKNTLSHRYVDETDQQLNLPTLKKNKELIPPSSTSTNHSQNLVSLNLNSLSWNLGGLNVDDEGLNSIDCEHSSSQTSTNCHYQSMKTIDNFSSNESISKSFSHTNNGNLSKYQSSDKSNIMLYRVKQTRNAESDFDCASIPSSLAKMETGFTPDKHCNSFLHQCILQGEEQTAITVIDQMPSIECVNLENGQGLSPLHLAVLTNQPNLVRRLICAGAIVEATDGNGQTPLHVACWLGHVDIVRHLVSPVTYMETRKNNYSIPFQSIPQNLELVDNDSKTCLELAICQRNLNIIKILLKLEGKDLSNEDDLETLCSIFCTNKCFLTPNHSENFEENSVHDEQEHPRTSFVSVKLDSLGQGIYHRVLGCQSASELEVQDTINLSNSNLS